MLDDQNFVSKSLELYQKYNENKLYYSDYDYYNKLVTADPFYITPAEYETVTQNGSHLWTWLAEQNNLFKELETSSSLGWLKNIIQSNLTPETYKYQQHIANSMDSTARIIRADLSSFPFGCHEAQLRWGIVGHTHFISSIFDSTIEVTSEEKLMNESLSVNIQAIIDEMCTADNEVCVFLMSAKYRAEMEHFGKLLTKTIPTLVTDFNQENFEVKGGKLLHKASGQVVKIVFRKELTLETLSKTEFGRQVIDLYIDRSVEFEPGLNLINDGKLGMAFAYDSRTSQFFSDESRKLFLKTSLFDDKFESFNNVFGTNFSDYSDFLAKLSPSHRKYIYKYGGYNLMMSFGASQVFRMDRSNNITREIIEQTKQLPVGQGEWIMQEFDTTRYSARFLKGDYKNPESCEVGYSEKCPARFMLFYKREKNEVRVINALANFVNDYWKARFKNSDSIEGTGAIVSTVRVKA